MTAETLKFIHQLTGTFLLGSSVFAWFLMFVTYRSRNTQRQLAAIEFTSLMDLWIVTPSAITLYVAGRVLSAELGLIMGDTPWIHQSIVIFGTAGTAWLIIMVPIQFVLKKRLAGQPAYFERLGGNRRLYHCWFFIGGIAKLSLIYVFYMMVTKN